MQLLPLLFLPFGGKKWSKRSRFLLLTMAGLAVAIVASGGCGGGSSSGGTSTPQTHQVSSSATVTPVVK